MRILHTSDWHLGRMLYGRKRYAEFEAFLDWLAQTLEQHAVDVLLVAGDIFDTSTPSNRAQALYYRFLCKVANSACRHVVVIAGNHDSPSFLDAPAELLQALNVQVIGQARDNPADEVLLLRDAQGQPELIVCAVPYLRERDIRSAEAGESLEDKERKLLEGIRQHYAEVVDVALHLRQDAGHSLPVVAMGHLFTAGGLTVDGDGVRELYVGSLAHVAAAIFPPGIDYLALGHLHVAQKVAGMEHLRYCGSPLPMGFGEARQRKSLCLVDLATDSQPPGQACRRVELLEIPVFQKLERLQGDWQQLEQRLQTLLDEQADSWLEVVYSGHELLGNLRERLEQKIEGSALEILRVQNRPLLEQVLQQSQVEESLDDLDADEVFRRCLDAQHIPQSQRPLLLQAYAETLRSLEQDDLRADQEPA